MKAPEHNRHNLASLHLDAIRGLAALCVFSGHLRALFLVDYRAVVQKSAGVKIIYFVTGFGHESVMVFFVLSGFFISSSIIRSIRADRWRWALYAQSRLTRLYAVLIPALLLGLLWDTLGVKLFGDVGVYHGLPEYKHVVGHVVPLLTAQIGFGNLLFLKGIRVPTFGSNGPLWSLSYEFWYYVLFPLCLLAVWPSTDLRSRILYGILAMGILVFVGQTISLYFLVWMMGWVIGVLRPTRITRSKFFLAGTSLALAVTLAWSRVHSGEHVFSTDVLVGLTFSAFVYALLSGKDGSVNTLYKATATFVSGFAYTLYLVHLPLLVFLNAKVIGTNGPWQPDLMHLLMVIALAGIGLLYTLFIWSFTESKTEVIRGTISRLLRISA